jgi:hypothetical protein
MMAQAGALIVAKNFLGVVDHQEYKKRNISVNGVENHWSILKNINNGIVIIAMNMHKKSSF